MYTLGAIKNKKDLRDIQIAQVQAPVSIPEKYQTDISFIPVMNQLANGSCVGHAHALIHIYHEWKENKKTVACSPRYLYALSKKYDGYAGEGTYPRTTAKIQVDKGCATEDKVKCDDTLAHADYINIPEEVYDAPAFKMKGYAFVPNDLQALKQAIYQNGLVAITISVGNFDNPIKKGSLGLHRVVAYGYDGDKIAFRNSWGMGWGEQGNGYFNWNEQEVSDMMTFVDMPNEIKEEAKKKYKYFTEAEVKGLKEELVRMLDKARKIAGIPFIILSGYRDEQHNEDVGGVKDSAHTKGLAVDIRARNSREHFLITKGLYLAGFKRISRKYTGHIHTDIDPVKPQEVLF